MDNLKGRGARRAAAKEAWRSIRRAVRREGRHSFVGFWRMNNDQHHANRFAADQKRSLKRRQPDADQAAA